MSKYYIKFDNSNNAKNKAEEETKEYAACLDGILIPNEQLKDKFLIDMQARIDKINQEYKRCRDVKVSIWISDETQHVSLADGICYIRIYKVKKEMTAN